MGKKEQPSPLRSLFVSCIFKDNKNPKALGFMRAFCRRFVFSKTFCVCTVQPQRHVTLTMDMFTTRLGFGARVNHASRSARPCITDKHQ